MRQGLFLAALNQYKLWWLQPMSMNQLLFQFIPDVQPHYSWISPPQRRWHEFPHSWNIWQRGWCCCLALLILLRVETPEPGDYFRGEPGLLVFPRRSWSLRFNVERDTSVPWKINKSFIWQCWNTPALHKISDDYIRRQYCSLPHFSRLPFF